MQVENSESLKSKPTVDLYFPENDEEEDNKKVIKMPKGHVNKKNMKLCLFVSFLILGVGLASVLIFIL